MQKNDKQQKRGNVLCHASMNIKNHESMCALINKVDGGTLRGNASFVLLLFQDIIISRSSNLPTTTNWRMRHKLYQIFGLYSFQLKGSCFLRNKVVKRQHVYLRSICL